jgi:hypothetical protein
VYGRVGLTIYMYLVEHPIYPPPPVQTVQRRL